MAHRPLVVPTSILSISPDSNNRWAFKRLCSSIGYCLFMFLCVFVISKCHFDTHWPCRSSYRVSSPALSVWCHVPQALLLSGLWACPYLLSYFGLQRYKISCYKKRKEKENSPSSSPYSLPAFLYCLLTVNHHTTYPLKGMCLRVNVRSSIPVLATVLTPDAIRSYLCGFFVLWKPFWADKIARFTTSEKTLNNFLRNTMQFLEKHYAVSAEIVQCFLEDV